MSGVYPSGLPMIGMHYFVELKHWLASWVAGSAKNQKGMGTFNHLMHARKVLMHARKVLMHTRKVLTCIPISSNNETLFHRVSYLGHTQPNLTNHILLFLQAT